MEDFLLQLTEYLNTENGMYILQTFVVCIEVALFLTLLLYDFIRGTFIFLVDRGIAIAEWIYRHTNHYKKKHEEFLVTYGSCRELLQDLYMTGHFESKKNEFRFLIKSLDEYKDRHIKRGDKNGS